jgi:hypothetical protein
MNNLASAPPPAEPQHLHKLLATEFDDDARVYDLFEEFLRHATYDRSFCLRLLALAGPGAGSSWELRRLAVLMLEHQVLKLSADDVEEFDLLLTRLKLKPAPGAGVPLADSVVKEGYSTTELRRFIPEFRRKLGRLNRVHEQLRGAGSSETALRDFIELSRRDCKLSLARYLFRPEEVVARVREQSKVTAGVKDGDAAQPPDVEQELRRVIKALPDFEAGILKKLCEGSNVYWVSDATGSEINSLVEYPLTTVVMVIKPPGSHVEFEIKRAGRRGSNPLGAVHTRDGDEVPPSHRLDGASMLGLLRYEANEAIRFANIYRLAHGADAPMAGYLTRTNIFTVPRGNASASILDYFTDPAVFGGKFRQMRAAMKEVVAAFDYEVGSNMTRLPGDLGLTAQFIGHVTPAQSILAGTSSFRLDKLALYLSDAGPEKYFAEGLNVAYSEQDARRLADEVLEEVLGVYSPPRRVYRSHGQYLKAAFAVAANRARADQCYLSVMQQIGKFWGTLLAVRGYSRGESFVARNVGLKSVWDGGEWKVRIIFMDHDALVIPTAQEKHFYVHGDLPCMKKDERFIWGESDAEHFAVSEVGYLQQIYRAGDRLIRRGRALAHRALKEGYRKTHEGMLNDARLRRQFDKTFIERLDHWDTFVRGYLEVKDDPAATAAWERATRKMLVESGYKRRSFDSFVELVKKHREFIETYSFLFTPDTAA